MAIRVGINGFGRIGRALVRAIVEQGLEESVQVVHINTNNRKTGSFSELVAHLLKYDSVHGIFNAQVEPLGENLVVVNGNAISISESLEPQACPWGRLDVDVVFDCTGKFCSKEKAQQHLKAGAKKVLLSAPGSNVDATIVYGVNHHILTDKDLIVSNASCTTNCLAPVVDTLQKSFGIESGIMTTIHAYTNDQMLLDNKHNDLYRARAAGLSMIPTKTGAANAIGVVIPELSGKLTGQAIRVPVPNVSLIDFTFNSVENISVQSINDCIQKASKNGLKGVMDVNTAPLVSVDFNHNSASSIVDLSHTLVINKTAKVLAWYDNEWGFTCRMLDVAKHMVQLSE